MMKKLFIGLVCLSLTIPAYADFLGNASTATELSANGANCDAGNYPLGVDASGAVESCTAAPTAASLSVDDLITLSGVAEGSVNLGEFTGTTIDDDQTIKASLQALETAVEGAGGHAEVTLAGQDYLTLSTQEITAGLINEDDINWDTIDRIAASNVNWTTMTDLTTDGAVVWGNVGAGELGNDSVINEDIDDDGNFVFTGSWDFGGGTFEVPNGAAPTTDAAGEIALDTTITDHQPLLQYYDGGENMTVIAVDTAQLPAEDNEIIKYDAASDKFVFEADAGGAAANFSWVLQPQQAKLPASNPMAIDAGNSQWRGLFDADTAECAEWETVLQPFSGTLKAKIYYSMASGTADEVEFELSIMCVTDADAADIDTDSFGSVDSLSATVPGTAGYLDVLSDASLEGDSCAEGDLMIVKICRDADDADNDDATGDAEFRKAYIYAE